MNVKIQKTSFSGNVKAVASKSHAHRLLICAALAEKPMNIYFSEESEDILATMGCLSALGAEFIRLNEGGYRVIPINTNSSEKKEKKKLECGESGSTFRFMLPIVAALGENVDFYLKGRLSERPISPLYEELESHGITMSQQGSNPFTCKGSLKSGDYQVSGNVSSQFISGLLFALPLLKEDSKLMITGKIESSSYIDMTLEAIRSFGIEVEDRDSCYLIKGGQKYCYSGDVFVEGDWSNAAFWLCAGALSERGVTCSNLNFSSLQGDKQVLEILKEFGADIEKKNETTVTVKKKKLQGISIDASNIPDLVPILAVTAATADGITKIYNAGRLRIKECDRLSAVCETLTTLGATVEETPDSLIIQGKKTLYGGKVQSYNDHRMVMMAAIAAGICVNEIEITGSEAVNKSYPGFFQDFAQMGGLISFNE